MYRVNSQNVIEKSFEFFIFLVSRDCFDLSMEVRKSLNFIPSANGNCPCVSGEIRVSQNLISSGVQQPVRQFAITKSFSFLIVGDSELVGPFSSFNSCSEMAEFLRFWLRFDVNYLWTWLCALHLLL